MRTSRLKQLRKKRRKGFIRLIRFISIFPFSAAFSLSLITTPSYAVMRSQAQVNTGHFSSAFVFPQTVQDMANKVKGNTDHASEQVQSLQALLISLPKEKNQQSPLLFMQIQQLSVSAKNSLDEAAALYSELEQYAIRAQTELDSMQSLYNQLKKKPLVDQTQLIDAQTNLQSVQRVNTYVQIAYMQAKPAIDMVYQLYETLLSSNGNKLQPTVSRSVYGSSVTGDIYDQDTTITKNVYEVNVTDAVYAKQTISQSVYDTSVASSVYGTQTVTYSTYGKEGAYFLHITTPNESTSMISPASKSDPVPSIPAEASNVTTSSNTPYGGRKKEFQNGITIKIGRQDPPNKYL
ncbi:hypothetical protein [Paenibacillus sp. Soil787]|uniref:hypothetical protein n=1 Tax=Paenibacillus sp. Soil787 TaxID=1736411 RepID=UPI0006F80E3A|nr:hypothetical protein [Paenibacillus sp. Soil787]KRF35909.1 hypothetical protein ASG93_25875 [Paenibacillus sp. Soil787]